MKNNGVSEKKQIEIGAMLSYLQMFFQIVIGILYTPIMLSLLGQSEYGLYNTVASTVSMLGILSLGFGSSYIRYFAKYKRNNDLVSIYKLNGAFIIVYLFIGVVAALCGVYLLNHLELVFKTGLSFAEMKEAKILMSLLVFNLSCGFPMSVFSSIISANEKFVFQKAILLLQTILSPCLTIPLLLLGKGAISLVMVSVMLAVSVWIINIYYCVYKLKMRIRFVGIDKNLYGSLFAYSLFIAINLIVDQINWNIDKILLARFKGTGTVAIYAIGFSLYSYYQNFSTAVSNVFTPRIHILVNKTEDNYGERRNELTSIFTLVGRIQYVILMFILLGFVFFGKCFIENIWAGREYSEAYFVALLLMIPATIPLIQNLGIEIQRAENKHQFRSIAYAVMAAINLMLSIQLCQKFGAIGSAIGTAVSLIIANGFIMNWYYHRFCDIDILHFWKEISCVSKGIIIPVIFGIFVSLVFSQNQISTFVLGIATYSIVYIISMWLYGLNDYEKNIVRRFLKRFSGGKNAN